MSATATATPKKWWQIYSGDRECCLFKELARGTHEWRTTDGLAKAAKITLKEVESICLKYNPLGVIQQHSASPDKWRYWERATPKKKQGSVSDEDKKRRVNEKLSLNKP